MSSLSTVSVLHQNSGGIGKSIPDAQEISRAKPEGNREGGGDGFPNTSPLVEYGHFLIINLSTGEWIRKSFPVGREGLIVLKSILPC